MNKSRFVGLILRGADPWHILGKIWPIFGPFINSDYLTSIFFLYEIFRKISQPCVIWTLSQRGINSTKPLYVSHHTHKSQRENHTWFYHITGFWVLTYTAWAFIEYSFVYEERRQHQRGNNHKTWQIVRTDQCLVLLQMCCSNSANKDIISRMKMNNFHIIKANPVLSLKIQVKNPLRTTIKKYAYLNFNKNILSHYNCLKTDFTGVRLTRYCT